jgi:hypothetical protein
MKRKLYEFMFYLHTLVVNIWFCLAYKVMFSYEIRNSYAGDYEVYCIVECYATCYYYYYYYYYLFHTPGDPNTVWKPWDIEYVNEMYQFAQWIYTGVSR